MTQQISRLSPLTRHIVWLIGLLLILLPLLAQAHGMTSATSDAVNTEMPCHQVSSRIQDSPCQHCQDGQPSLNCDCCDQVTSPTLTLTQGRFITIYLRVGIHLSQNTLEPPEPLPGPLYRPPIQSLI